jgi:outer membrane protein assembly factor BamB
MLAVRNISKSLALILILIMAISSLSLMVIKPVCAASADDWPMPEHDSANTGYSSSIVSANPVSTWTFPNPRITHVGVDHTIVDTAPVIANGYLYIADANGYSSFYCLNASTGQELWSYSPAAGSSVVSVLDGIAYVDIDAGIAALNASTGVQIWNVTTENTTELGGGAFVINNGVL